MSGAGTSEIPGEPRNSGGSGPERLAPLVLLVDDEEGNRSALRLVLARQGWRVLEAENGEQALPLAREHRPDAILMDLAMPVLNGLEAAELLRQSPETAQIPMIALTASWLGGDRERLRQAGFHGGLVKPFTTSALVAELRRVLPFVGDARGAPPHH